MRVVILGCGRVGAELARQLFLAEHDVTVIDQSDEAFKRLDKRFPRERTILGNGTDEDVLRRAGLERADAFIAVTNGDNRNILAAQIVRLTFKTPKVMCRIYDPQRQQTYNELGLESISPTIVGAKLFFDALIHPLAKTTSTTRSIASGDSVPLPTTPPAAALAQTPPAQTPPAQTTQPVAGAAPTERRPAPTR